MARITVEDCLEHVDNRFDLVMLASRRARALRNYNTEAMVDEENDKPTVIALREIAKGVMSHELLDSQEISHIYDLTSRQGYYSGFTEKDVSYRFKHSQR